MLWGTLRYFKVLQGISCSYLSLWLNFNQFWNPLSSILLFLQSQQSWYFYYLAILQSFVSLFCTNNLPVHNIFLYVPLFLYIPLPITFSGSSQFWSDSFVWWWWYTMMSLWWFSMMSLWWYTVMSFNASQGVWLSDSWGAAISFATPFPSTWWSSSSSPSSWSSWSSWWEWWPCLND